MKIKCLILFIPLWFFTLTSYTQINDDIEILLNNHDWVLVDNYHINENEAVLGGYKMVFTNAKGYWRPGYRIHLKNNGELIAGNFPLCGTGPQVWSSLSGYWEISNEDSIVLHYTENKVHYMNMEPPSKKEKIQLKPRKEIYKIDVINDQFVGLNPIN